MQRLFKRKKYLYINIFVAMVRSYLCFVVVSRSWAFVRSENLYKISFPLKTENNLQPLYWVIFQQRAVGYVC